MGHTAVMNIGLFFGITGRIIPTSSACTSGSRLAHVMSAAPPGDRPDTLTVYLEGDGRLRRHSTDPVVLRMALPFWSGVARAPLSKTLCRNMDVDVTSPIGPLPNRPQQPSSPSLPILIWLTGCEPVSNWEPTVLASTLLIPQPKSTWRRGASGTYRNAETPNIFY